MKQKINNFLQAKEKSVQICSLENPALFKFPPFKFNFEKSIQRCRNALKLSVVNKSIILEPDLNYILLLDKLDILPM